MMRYSKCKKVSLLCASDYLALVTKVLEEGITVLDSGCGPATWTFEVVYAEIDINIL